MTTLTVICLIAFVGTAGAQGKGKGKGKDQGKEQDKAQGQGKESAKGKEPGKGKEQVAKKHSHVSGPQLLGNKIKTNGSHVLQQRGKHTASVNVKDGKITGVNVKHSEKGDVPVKKYKTHKKMATRMGQSNGVSFASTRSMLPQIQDLGTVWIGYAYIDDYGEEVIYWFPYEMIYDGDAGAIEYVPLD